MIAIRMLRILAIIYRYRLDLLLPQAAWPWYLKWLAWSFKLVPCPKISKGERLRLALEKLGPLFIKFGQLLSTRSDVLDEQTMRALSRLQDQVAPFDSKVAIKLIEHGLGQPVDQLFDHFEVKPLASASIAQVHAARLKTGESVVIKIVRPNIAQTIQQDLALLSLFAKWIHRFHPDGKRLRPKEVVNDYRFTLLSELDLKKEAANTSQLRRNFAAADLLYVPKVYWSYCRDNILVLERIAGIPVNDVASLIDQGTDLQLLAERGVEIFFTQVFTHNFFHADMHPGNIFVAQQPIAPPQYIAIDCAIVGSLSDFDRYYVARCLLAIFNRDYHTVAKLHVEGGWVARSTPVNEFESAIRSVCEPIFEKPLAEISFAQLLLYLFQTARRFDMQVQPSQVLLQKTMLHIEGLGKQLYPDLDLWSTAKPFLEKWMKQRYSPRSMAKAIEQQMPGWLEHLPDIPDLIYDRLKANSSHAEVHPMLLKTLRRQQRLQWLMAAGMVLIVGLWFFR